MPLIKERIQMANSNKTEAAKKSPRFNINLNFTGVLMLFVLVSIAYSTYVVYLGTTGLAPKVMLIPQALFGASIAIHKFTKN